MATKTNLTLSGALDIIEDAMKSDDTDTHDRAYLEAEPHIRPSACDAGSILEGDIAHRIAYDALCSLAAMAWEPPSTELFRQHRAAGLAFVQSARRLI